MGNNISKLSLFRLIKSLSANEKGYFKKFMGKSMSKEDSIYLDLFNLLDEQSSYDADELMNKLSIEKRNLAPKKHYLFEKILDALSAYQSSSSAHLEITKLHNHCTILIDRGYLKEAYSVIQKAKKLCKKNFSTALLFDFLEIEFGLLPHVFENFNDYLKELDRIQKEIDESCNELHNTKQLCAADTAYVKAIRNLNEVKDKKVLKEYVEGEINKINQTELNPKQEDLLCFRKAKFIEHFDKNDLAIYEAQKRGIELHEEHPKYFFADQASITNHAGLISDFGITCAKLGKIEEFEQAISRLDAFERSVRSKTSDFSKWMIKHSKLDLLGKGTLECGDLKYFEDLPDKQLEPFLSGKNPLNKVSNQQLMITLGLCFFILERYDLARKCYLNSLNHYHKRQVTTSYITTQLLLLLLDFEKEHIDLGYNITNAKNWIKKSKRNDAVSMLLFVEKIKELDQAPNNQRPSIYKEVVEIFSTKSSNSTKAVTAWATSKLTKSSIKECYLKHIQNLHATPLSSDNPK